MSVDKVKPVPGRRVDLPDGAGGIPGLALRISEKGVKSFALRYRINGKQQRLTLGQHPVMTLVEARDAARGALQLVEKGIDPAAAKREAKRESEAEPERDSVRAVVAKYVDKRLKPRTRRWRDVEAMLRRDVVAHWGDRPIASITKRDVRDLIEGIVDRGSPVLANRVLYLIRRLFAWAIKNDYVETNPTIDVEPPTEERPRDRALKEAEIRLLWQAWNEMGHPFGTIGKLLLLTGQRRGEVAGMHWADLDLERALWHQPSARTKTREPHTVPLSDAAVEFLGSVPRVDGSPLVFPATFDKIKSKTDRNAVSGFSKAKRTTDQKVLELLRKRAQEAGEDPKKVEALPGWTWHDLRRTCRTHMARLGVLPHIGERILNHTDGTRNPIARIYDTHRYLPEMRQALELWASEVDRIVAGEPLKVVALRARRG